MGGRRAGRALGSQPAVGAVAVLDVTRASWSSARLHARQVSEVPVAIPASAGRSAAQKFSHAERQIEGLPGVQSRVARGGVAEGQLVLLDLFGPAEAFGDVVPGELDVDAAGPGALARVGAEEPDDLGH